jgi:hypothetical protein
MYPPLPPNTRTLNGLVAQHFEAPDKTIWALHPTVDGLTAGRGEDDPEKHA